MIAGVRCNMHPHSPPCRLQAQQLLWAACHAYEDEQAAADVRTRQLVCQRYKPLDVALLQVGALLAGYGASSGLHSATAACLGSF